MKDTDKIYMAEVYYHLAGQRCCYQPFASTDQHKVEAWCNKFNNIMESNIDRWIHAYGDLTKDDDGLNYCREDCLYGLDLFIKHSPIYAMCTPEIELR